MKLKKDGKDFIVTNEDHATIMKDKLDTLSAYRAMVLKISESAHSQEISLWEYIHGKYPELMDGNYTLKIDHNDPLKPVARFVYLHRKLRG
ncbi:MAG TPA: hypothetical protein ENH82_07700 [bacterium]|nr:hypothetical protein [bacterium]